MTAYSETRQVSEWAARLGQAVHVEGAGAGNTAARHKGGPSHHHEPWRWQRSILWLNRKELLFLPSLSPEQLQ